MNYCFVKANDKQYYIDNNYNKLFYVSPTAVNNFNISNISYYVISLTDFYYGKLLL